MSVCGFALASLLAPALHAQITDEPAPPFPDPAKFAHGLYADAEAGAVVFLGRAGDKMSPGIAVGARVGYELTRWFALQAHVLGSTHEGDFPGMPEAGQLLQLYQFTAEARFTMTFRQVSVFAVGGAGFARMSSNLLATAGLLEHPNGLLSATFGGGGGIDWHTLNRHFSVGLVAEFRALADVRGSSTLPTTAYLRYTF